MTGGLATGTTKEGAGVTFNLPPARIGAASRPARLALLGRQLGAAAAAVAAVARFCWGTGLAVAVVAAAATLVWRDFGFSGDLLAPAFFTGDFFGLLFSGDLLALPPPSARSPQPAPVAAATSSPPLAAESGTTSLAGRLRFRW